MSEIATRSPIQELVEHVRSDDFRNQIAAALPGNVTPARFVRVTVTALRENPEVLAADRTSLLSSVVRCAQDGLLPDSREAALVVFGSKVVYMPMIGGFRKIAAEHGWSIRTQVVYANDEFDYELGLEPTLRHRPAKLLSDRGEAIGAYAIAVHKDGRKEIEVLNKDDIAKVREVSKAKNSGPWKDWTDRMWEKSAGRRLFAKLPLEERDRERISRVLDASDLAPGEAAALLYGSPAREAEATNGERRQIEAGEPEAGIQSHAETTDGSASAASDPDFEGEEPIEGEIVSESFKAPSGAAVEENPDVLAANAAGALGFTSGRYSGKTISEVAAEGDDGLSYIEWAMNHWQTPPLKTAVFDYTRVFAPDLYQKVMAKQETAS